MIRIRRCASLSEVRREIDRLDKMLVRLLAERAGYVAEAARVKTKRSEIVDRARIEAVVARASARARTLGADPLTVARIYRAMIAAFIAFERRAFVGKPPGKRSKVSAGKRPAKRRREAAGTRAKARPAR
ncbi:MAG TPA: chorismate mutase [Alphaproteobacteria bacterium]|nr:chorismate mutase [Alphaproteobacteria bacterium]